MKTHLCTQTCSRVFLAALFLWYQMEATKCPWMAEETGAHQTLHTINVVQQLESTGCWC